jgi:hypothetical protein
LALPVAMAACVTVTRATGEFPVRPDWQGCMRGRLEGLGYSVATGDSALDARRGRVRLSMHPASSYARRGSDSVAVPTVRVTANAPLGSDVDSLSIYCGGVQLPG